MSLPLIIALNVGIAVVPAAILILVMLIPARLDAQHRETGKGRRRKLDREPAAIRGRYAPVARGRALRPIRDQH